MQDTWKHLSDETKLGYMGDTRQLKYFIKHLWRSRGLKVKNIEEIMKGVYWLQFKNKEERDMAFDPNKAFEEAQKAGNVIDGTVPKWNPENPGETLGIRVESLSEYTPKNATEPKKFITGTDLATGEKIGFTLGVLLERIFLDFAAEDYLDGRCFVVRYEGKDKQMKLFKVAEIDDPDPEMAKQRKAKSDTVPF